MEFIKKYKLKIVFTNSIKTVVEEKEKIFNKFPTVEEIELVLSKIIISDYLKEHCNKTLEITEFIEIIL